MKQACVKPNFDDYKDKEYKDNEHACRELERKSDKQAYVKMQS